MAFNISLIIPVFPHISTNTLRLSRFPSTRSHTSNRSHFSLSSCHCLPNVPAHQPSSDSASKGKVLISAEVKQRVRNLYEEAQGELREGKVERARFLLEKCLSLHPRDAHSWLALARLEEKAELGPRAARKLFRKGLGECPRSVHLLQAWAVLEYRCGNVEEARRLFKRGLDIQPENSYVCQAWGLLEQRTGNTDMARKLFSRSNERRPTPEVCCAWGILEAGEGDVTQARALFDQALKACRSIADPAAEKVLRAWAEMEDRLGDAPRARELLAKALGAHPRSAQVHMTLAKLEARRGRAKRALELMRSAADLSPRPPSELFNSWAQIEMNVQHNVDGARALLLKGHQLHPRDPALLQTLGVLEDRAGKPDAAIAYFQKSIRARPMAPAYVGWAILMEKQGQLEQAAAAFEKALACDILHGPAYNAYGSMLARNGRMEEARKVYERGLKVNAYPSIYHGYGQMELKFGADIARARELFREGVNQTRDNTSFTWHSWGMLELRERNPLEARRVFREAVRRYPRNSCILVGQALALAFADVGISSEDEKARHFFKRAVVADPTHAQAWQAWGVFEHRRGRADSARALFRRGLRICPTHGALWQAWGKLESLHNNCARARMLYERGAALCTGHVHLLQAWACLEVRCTNIEKARSLLDQALVASPCHGPIWNAYGLLEARFGTIAKARKCFETGIRRAPHHAPLYRTYGKVEADSGNYDRARNLFKQGLKCDPRYAPLYHAFAEFEAKLGNLNALAELKKTAEYYFGSERKAQFAINQGRGQGVLSLDSPDNVLDDVYALKSTPMELALDNLESTL